MTTATLNSIPWHNQSFQEPFCNYRRARASRLPKIARQDYGIINIYHAVFVEVGLRIPLWIGGNGIESRGQKYSIIDVNETVLVDIPKQRHYESEDRKTSCLT